MTWTRFLSPAQGPEAIILLPTLIRICRSLVVPAIVSSPSVGRYLCTQLAKIVDSASEARLSKMEPNKLHEAVVYFCTDMRMIENFIFTLLTESDITTVQLRQFHRPLGLELFNALSQAVERLESKRISQGNTTQKHTSAVNIARYAATVYTSCRLTVSMWEVPMTVQDAIDMGHNIARDSNKGLWLLMHHFKNGQECCAVECPESYQTSVGEDFQFQRCGGCRVVAYCGKECQVRAWKDKRLPHRDICKSLSMVMDACGNHLDNADKFTKNVKKAKIPEAVMRKNVVWLSSLLRIKSRKDGVPAIDKLDGGWLDMSKSEIAAMMHGESAHCTHSNCSADHLFLA